jgi:hypothetical protein
MFCRVAAQTLSRKEVTAMTLTGKDVAATVLTILAVLAFVATHEGWNVWLIGDSHRWAAGVILVLGMLTCGQGSPSKGPLSLALALLGVTALVLTILAIATGSLTLLSLLVGDIVVLWAASTFRHASHAPRKPQMA